MRLFSHSESRACRHIFSAGLCMPTYSKCHLGHSGWFLVAMSCWINRFPEHLKCGWSWPPCLRDMTPWNYFLWGYFKDHVYHTNLHTLQKLQAGIEVVAERDHRSHMWQICVSFTVTTQHQRISYWTYVPHEDHTHIKSPWKWGFIHVSYSSVS
jgi:hypothetical protein